MDEHKETGSEHEEQPEITLDELMKRFDVLLPLLQGWNPDIMVGVDINGMALAGLLNCSMRRELEGLMVRKRGDEYSVESYGQKDLRDKRVLLIADRSFPENWWPVVEQYLERQQVLSVCRFVALGKGVEYTCFPEYSRDSVLPWEVP